jgi:cytochrome oxidase Cu insertion factor (SCO1/SenC/PrrC family)
MAGPIARLATVALLAMVLIVALEAQAAPGPAPAFSLELFNGKTLRLADLRGRPVILLFWTQW